ncbi:MAG: hypothetical protein OXE42_13300 [Gammaproteobacteria bacterium]|nr:hypothetical protein [Gammaproteobacteria bacterium]
MSETDLNLLTEWSRTRHGAWAGGGFHYQHLVATLILVRQWAGLAPSGYLVPEGFEDCVIELSERRIWLQIKSRNAARFSQAEVQSIFFGIDSWDVLLDLLGGLPEVFVLGSVRTENIYLITNQSGTKFIQASLDECLQITREILVQDWRFRVVPIMNRKVLASFAVLPSSSMLSSQEMILPDMDFAKDLKGCIDHSFAELDIIEFVQIADTLMILFEEDDHADR